MYETLCKPCIKPSVKPYKASQDLLSKRAGYQHFEYLSRGAVYKSTQTHKKVSANS